jgi:hypothetical protein
VFSTEIDEPRQILLQYHFYANGLGLSGGRIAYVGDPLNSFRCRLTTVIANSESFGIFADEYLQVIRWILERVKPTEAAMGKLCRDLFSFWYPKILTNRIPLSPPLRILNNATRIDRNAIRKLIPRAHCSSHDGFPPLTLLLI